MSTNKAGTHGKKAYTLSGSSGFTNIKINIEAIFHYVSPDFLILIHFLYKVGFYFLILTIFLYKVRQMTYFRAILSIMKRVSADFL